MPVLIKTAETLALLQQARAARRLHESPGGCSAPAAYECSPYATYRLASGVAIAPAATNAVLPGIHCTARVLVVSPPPAAPTPMRRAVDRLYGLRNRAVPGLGYNRYRGNGRPADTNMIIVRDNIGAGLITVGAFDVQQPTNRTFDYVQPFDPAACRPAGAWYSTRPKNLPAFGLVIDDPRYPGRAVAVLTTETVLVCALDGTAALDMRVWALVERAIAEHADKIPEAAVIETIRQQLRHADALARAAQLVSTHADYLRRGAAGNLESLAAALGQAQTAVLTHSVEEAVVRRLIAEITSEAPTAELPMLAGIPDDHPLRKAAEGVQLEMTRVLGRRLSASAEQVAMASTDYVKAAAAMSRAAAMDRTLTDLPDRLVAAVERYERHAEIDDITLRPLNRGGSGDVHMLSVTTNMIRVMDPRTGVLHDTGRFRLDIPLDADPKHVSVYNLSWYCGWRGPHVMTNDTFCYGTALADVRAAMQAFDVAGLLGVLLAFMHTVNVKDGAGKCIWRFPIGEEEANRIGLPKGLRNAHFQSQGDIPYTMFPDTPPCIQSTM